MMDDKLVQDSASFQLFNNYYDLLYNEKDYEKETEYVTGILKGHNAKANKLLELGFGTGNYSKQLSDAGFRVTGVEKSEHMVAIAKSKAIPHFVPVLDDISSFKLNKKFDAVLSLFHVISYLTKNQKVIACFKQVHQHLKKNGIFIFDVWYTPAVYSQQPRNTSKHTETEQYEITRLAEPVIDYEENVVHVKYQLNVKNKITGQNEVLNETHSMRHFSSPEIKLMAKLSGFKLVHAEEFFTAKQPCAETWGVCYILQKND